MKITKYKYEKGLLLVFGYIYIPSTGETASTPACITSIHPSVVIISKRVLTPSIELSKFSFGFSHVPPKDSQSALVTIFSRISGSSIEHFENYPLNESTPMMEKIRRNKQQTIVTLLIEGIEDKRAFTISFIPLFLEIILRGLRALSALRALTD